MSRTRIWRHVIHVGLAALVFVAGLGVFQHLKATRPEVKRRAGPELATLVEVQTLATSAGKVEVRAMGTVVPSRQMTVMTEVRGQVMKHHPSLVPGGVVKAGELLVELDPREYTLAVGEMEANVARALFDLKVERGRKRIAEREWKLIEQGADASAKGHELALRKPHLRQKQAALSAARRGLERAELNVARTQIVAPFNAVVKDERVELGQVVGIGSQLATLVGTDGFWVKVAVPVDALSRIRVPGVNLPADEAGAAATVRMRGSQGVLVERKGQVLRLMPELEPQGRMAQLIIAVSSPLEPNSQDGKAQLPLLLGSYVEVSVVGETLNDVIQIPRIALREGAKVWLVDEENRFRIRDVSVAWGDRENVAVRGLKAGQRLVMSRVATPVEGMLVSVQGEEEATPVAPETESKGKRPKARKGPAGARP